MYNSENLFVLQFLHNSPKVEAQKLNLKILPFDVKEVNTEKGYWTWEDKIIHETQTLKFGQPRRFDHSWSQSGIIGIFDKNDDEHIKTMVKISNELGINAH